MTDYYTKVKKIGKGSYGSVKLFESKIDFKKYAIKKIKTFKMKPKERELVKQEVNLLIALKQFKHPNIMLLDTYFKDDLEKYYLVINYEEADTL